ncbi:MAG: Lrp/AsnC family transcriptional regulator, partial [Hyphomicrobiales bacterium]
MKLKSLDQIDHRILSELQHEGGLSQRELAERVGLSQNACWRRLQTLNASGVLQGTKAKVDRRKT